MNWRPTDEDLRNRVVARAAEKNISVNEWLNRAITAALAKPGRLKITTTIEAEF